MKKVTGPRDEIIERPIKFPVWFDPRARGNTSMCAGLNTAVEVLHTWCSAHPRCFPPTVLHVTDGHPTDGNPEPIADQLKSVTTDDGCCLLFNLHVDVGGGAPLVFPMQDTALRDRYGKTLYRMSSVLPPYALQAARSKGYHAREGARAFVFNASIEAIADFFDIGTRPVFQAAADRPAFQDHQ